MLLLHTPVLSENSNKSSFFIKNWLPLENFFVFCSLKSHIFSSLVRINVMLGCKPFHIGLVFEQIHDSLLMLPQLFDCHSWEGILRLRRGGRRRLTSTFRDHALSWSYFGPTNWNITSLNRLHVGNIYVFHFESLDFFDVLFFSHCGKRFCMVQLEVRKLCDFQIRVG
jgi:hypothetical protein